MRMIKTSLLLVLLTGVLATPAIYGNDNATTDVNIIHPSDIPAKTVVIKHPAASNINSYFATAKVINFEVYKIGTKVDVEIVKKGFQNESAVESCTIGNLTGDYQAFTVSLKVAKNKAWFITTLKRVGLNNIKINNNPVIAVDQL